VPFERAFKLFADERTDITADTAFDLPTLQRVLHATNDVQARSTIERLQVNGILLPAGKGQWNFGKGFLEYARTRES
jgi:hypothetical protein